MRIERYTTVLRADHLQLQPDCPVHVIKLQCTRDNLTGSVILQLRYVNRSERIVEGLILHIALLDEAGTQIDEICSLPVTGLKGNPHQCFGDDKTVILPKRPDSVKVTIEQVFFTDAYSWRREPESETIEIEKPVRICGKVQPMRREGYWYCSCGMVNPQDTQNCGYCGARAVFAPPMPEQPAAPPQKQEIAPVEFLPVSPLALTPVTPESFGKEEVPAQQEPEPKKRKGLWITLSVLAAALLLGAALYFFGYPYYRYYQAGQLALEQKYEEAIEEYRKLGDYMDAPEQIEDCLYSMAVNAFNNGDFAACLEQAQTLADPQRKAELSLQSLHSLCSQALTGQSDYNAALQYLEQAKQYVEGEEPEWFAEVMQQSRYLEAMELFDHEEYARAKELFEKSEYGNYSEWVAHCDYQLAVELYDSRQYEQAVEAFDALGDYEDSRQLADEARYAYVRDHYDVNDQTTISYLQTLIEHQNSQAQTLYDELFAWTVDFSRADTAPSQPLSNVNQAVIRYSVTGGRTDGSKLSISVQYTLPSGNRGTLVLTSNLTPGGSGVAKWSDLSDVKDDTTGSLQLVFIDTVTQEQLGSLSIPVEKPTTAKETSELDKS